MDDETVHALTTAIASGDPEAFATFYGAYFDMMYDEARRATGRDEAFCLDVVHDAMLRVVRKMTPLPARGALCAWLRRTVRSCAYDRLRTDARRARRERATARGRAAVAAGADGDALAERLEWLRRQLDELDDDASSLLVMRHRLGGTLERIGAVVGLTGSAVDGRVRRTLDLLRRRATEDDR